MDFGTLSPELRAQLERVPPSDDRGVAYRPCRVRLRSGAWRDYVYVLDADEYHRAWGVWPADDRAKREILVDDVVEIEESPHRLPAALASRIYAGGESGMGYTMFTVVLRDGRRLPRVVGNAVDFPVLPVGVTTDDVADVVREGREVFRHRSPRPDEGAAHYAWCLYRAT
ncbi:hypothetical protein [Patulibacter americanus]|uniref:hypothetical protein n=1 Tax=Patulibacter americanus TaxID=588672 RepID=UPI0003B5919B|nr:hypothetical protein [Patulibacter americanus]